MTGVAIHRKDCKNYQNMILQEPTREIEVRWDENLLENVVKRGNYKFSFKIIALDRPNLLMEIVTVISSQKINLLSINAHNLKKVQDKIVSINVVVELNGKNEYKILESQILKIKDIISIER